MLEHFPQELRSMPRRWTTGRLDNKHPVTTRGGDRIDQWHDDADDFVVVVNHINRTGNRNLCAGFVLNSSRDVWCIDLDHCGNPAGGQLTDIAHRIVDRADTYTEISTSGDGLHLFGLGSKPELFRSCEKRGLPDGKSGTTGGIEVYDHGRYIIATGNVFENRAEIATGSQVLEEIQENYFGTCREINTTSPSRASGGRRNPRLLLDALRHVAADDYHVWYRVGMALHYEFGDAGFAAWKVWSATSTKFDGIGLERKWKSFDRPCDTPVTGGSIYYLALEAGWLVPENLEVRRELDVTMAEGVRCPS